jgi:hypothetical protein
MIDGCIFIIALVATMCFTIGAPIIAMIICALIGIQIMIGRRD